MPMYQVPKQIVVTIPQNANDKVRLISFKLDDNTILKNAIVEVYFKGMPNLADYSNLAKNKIRLELHGSSTPTASSSADPAPSTPAASPHRPCRSMRISSSRACLTIQRQIFYSTASIMLRAATHRTHIRTKSPHRENMVTSLYKKERCWRALQIRPKLEGA